MAVVRRRAGGVAYKCGRRGMAIIEMPLSPGTNDACDVARASPTRDGICAGEMRNHKYKRSCRIAPVDNNIK